MGENKENEMNPLEVDKELWELCEKFQGEGLSDNDVSGDGYQSDSESESEYEVRSDDDVSGDGYQSDNESEYEVKSGDDDDGDDDDFSVDSVDSLVLTARRLPHLVRNPSRFRSLRRGKLHNRKKATISKRKERKRRFIKSHVEPSGETSDDESEVLHGHQPLPTHDVDEQDDDECPTDGTGLNRHMLRTLDSFDLAKQRLTHKKKHRLHTLKSNKHRSIGILKGIPKPSLPGRSISLPLQSVSNCITPIKQVSIDHQPRPLLIHHTSLSSLTGMVRQSPPTAA